LEELLGGGVPQARAAAGPEARAAAPDKPSAGGLEQTLIQRFSPARINGLKGPSGPHSADGVIAFLIAIMVLHEAAQKGRRHEGGHSWTLRARLLS